MYPNVDGMLALAIVAMKVNFVCRHEPCCIITTLNCNGKKNCEIGLKLLRGYADSNRPSGRTDQQLCVFAGFDFPFGSL
jgi:hypothetical protein